MLWKSTRSSHSPERAAVSDLGVSRDGLQKSFITVTNRLNYLECLGLQHQSLVLSYGCLFNVCVCVCRLKVQYTVGALRPMFGTKLALLCFKNIEDYENERN